jgi:hypothetical protein
MGDFYWHITQMTSTVHQHIGDAAARLLVLEPGVVMWVLAVAGILAIRAARN